MRLVVSEDEFAVLTVLISVWVNDSAPSLGTHYRVGKVQGTERKMEPVSPEWRKKIKKQPKCIYTAFLLFWFNFKSPFPTPLFSISTNHFCPTPPHIFKSGLMLRGAELISHMV